MSNFNDNNTDFQRFNSGRGQYGGDFAGDLNQDPSTFDSTVTGAPAGDPMSGQNAGWDATTTPNTGGTMGNTMSGQNAGWNYSQGTTGASDYTGGGQFQGSGRTAADFGSTGAPHASMGDKVRGTTEKFVGKATRNPELAERGQERASGAFNDQR